MKDLGPTARGVGVALSGSTDCAHSHVSTRESNMNAASASKDIHSLRHDAAGYSFMMRSALIWPSSVMSSLGSLLPVTSGTSEKKNLYNSGC